VYEVLLVSKCLCGREDSMQHKRAVVAAAASCIHAAICSLIGAVGQSSSALVEAESSSSKTSDWCGAVCAYQARFL
jgi:hypothetical protein